MDRGLAARLEQRLGTGVSAARRLGGQHGVSHFWLQLGDARAAFVKAGRPSAGDEPRHQSPGHTAWVAGYAVEVRQRLPGGLARPTGQEASGVPPDDAAPRNPRVAQEH